MYPLGGVFYNIYRPDGFDYNIKWEETMSYNIGIDYGFFRDRLSGSLDFYLKETYDLLAIIDVPAGVNFKNEILTNVGSMTNKGFEFELNAVAIQKKDFQLDVGANMTMKTRSARRTAARPQRMGHVRLLFGSTIENVPAPLPTYVYVISEM